MKTKNCNCDNKSKNSADSWLRKTWRPMMAAQYMVVCVIDFVVFPIMWTGYQAYSKVPLTQWDPLTLKATGLYHLALGAVCGVAAYTRGQENIHNAQNMGKYSGYDIPAPPPSVYDNRTSPEYDVPRGGGYP